MQSITDAVNGLVWSIASVLIGPTILLLLLKRFVPVIGDQLWHAYSQLLAKLMVGLIVAPIRLIRLLFREAMGRRHR